MMVCCRNGIVRSIVLVMHVAVDVGRCGGLIRESYKIEVKHIPRSDVVQVSGSVSY